MAQKAVTRSSAGLPPRGPTVTTQEQAQSLSDVAGNWIIVAVRLAGRGEWEPTMPYEEWRLFREMREDGAFHTTQRRDPIGTVLLAKLRGPNE